MPIVIAAHDVFKFCKHELKQLQGIRSGVVPVRQREAARRSAVTVRSDEYNGGKRAPTTTVELLNASAVGSSATTGPPHDKASAASAFKPSSKRGRDPHDDGASTTALQNRIRTDGLPNNSIVQVLNDQTDDNW